MLNLDVLRYYVLLIVLCLKSLEVVGVIHGRHTENIKDYHLAVPHKATPEGEFHSFHLPHTHEYDAKQFMKRKKRELEDPDAVHYGISIDNKLHHLELWPNRDFLHPQVIFEHRDPTLPFHKRQATLSGLKGKKMCYYLGRVRGADRSKVSLSTCDGLLGHIYLGDKMYFIEPVRGHSPNDKGHHLHVVYEPSAESFEDFCGVDNSPGSWETAIKNRIREEYSKGKNVFRRQAYEIVPMWMEIMMVIDKNMILKHRGKRDIEQWILTVLSTVKSYYADSSMEGSFEPVVVRILYLEKEEEEIDLSITRNCDTSLSNFCNWVQKLRPKDETHPNYFDVAILLSDYDFCNGKGDCGTQGLAYTGGACAQDLNCQLNEDKGMITPVIVSHEQGHLLGMSHDGQPPVPCSPNDTSDYSWFVMSPIAYMRTLRWSPCSMAAMTELAKSHLLDCFRDQPVYQEYALDKPWMGVVYDVDEQCRMKGRDIAGHTGACMKDSMLELSKKSKVDYNRNTITINSQQLKKFFLDINCNFSLFCEIDGECRGYKDDWADGTTCGPNKWCVKKYCVDKGKRPEAIDGGWGEWGEWSACSKTCGKGAQHKTRLCDNPKPENFGKFCVGQASTFRICNPQPCPLDAEPFRDEQCRLEWPKTVFVIKKVNKLEDLLRGGFKLEKPCELYCYIKSSDGERLISVANVVGDGAKCEIGNPSKMCVAGNCISIPCDSKLESDAIMDQCGICNGDGTRCKLVEGNDTQAATGYRMLTVVPTGAKSVKIEEKEPSSHILALGLPDGKTVYFNADMIPEWPGVYPLGKLHKNFFLYGSIPGQGSADTESFVWDNTFEDVGVYLGHRNKKAKKTVGWSWIEPSETPTREAKYSWEIVEYKECSAVCEGGIQEAVVACYEEVGGKVAESFCKAIEKPKAETKKCNDKPCEPDWKVGDWGPCRACKNKGGVSLREVQCVKPNPRKVGDDILMEDSDCKTPKPGAVQLCETRKKCGTRKRKASFVPAKFQDSIWRQMNKLHLVKRGASIPKVYLKGKAPTTTKRTTTFTWIPPPFVPGKHIVIDDEYGSDRPDPVLVQMKVVTVNATAQEAEGLQQSTFLVEGTTLRIKGGHFPTRYNKSQKQTKSKKPKT